MANKRVAGERAQVNNKNMTEETPIWKCLGCGAVCDSSEDEVPSPCAFCGSDDVVLYDDAPSSAPPDVYHD